MKLLCFTSAKGGTGTSLAVACLAYALKAIGKKCLAADIHGGCRTLDLYMGTDGEFVFDLYDVLCGNCNFEDAVVHSGAVCDFVSSSQSVAYTREDYSGVMGILQNACSEYDYVLLDCPVDFATDDAVRLCDGIVVVTGCDKASVRCAEKHIAEMPADTDKKLIINNIVPELIQGGHHTNVDDICDLCGVPPLGLIPYEPSAVFAANGAQLMNDKSLPMSQAFANMAQRLEGNSVAAVSFDRKTYFSKLIKKYSRRK